MTTRGSRLDAEGDDACKPELLKRRADAVVTPKKPMHLPSS